MNKIAKDLRKMGRKKYTIYELNKPFPFYLLDLNKLDICLPYYDSFFKYIVIVYWASLYNVVFYDEKERYATHKKLSFIEEKNAIEYFNKLLLDIFKNEEGEYNG